MHEHCDGAQWVFRAPRACHDDGAEHRRLRRFGIAFFFGSVAVNAALGIAALVDRGVQRHAREDLRDVAVVDRGPADRARVPAGVGARPARAGSARSARRSGRLAFALVIASLWSGGDSEVLGKTMGSTMIAGGRRCTLACLLALPRLAPRYRLAFPVALVLLTIAAAMLVVATWVEPESSWYPRTFGVVAVLLAATAVSIPVLATDRAAPRSRRPRSSRSPSAPTAGPRWSRRRRSTAGRADGRSACVQRPAPTADRPSERRASPRGGSPLRRSVRVVRVPRGGVAGQRRACRTMLNGVSCTVRTEPNPA